ncbi:Transcription factor Adf-1, partial [Stegodyphus mimosarum]
MEAFIDKVKSYPCLWDVDNPGYKDFEVMEKAWMQVASSTNFPDSKAAKMQWKKLRDNFREALKRQKDSKSGGGRMWRYQQQMEFLIPYMQSKTQDFREDSDRTSGDGNEIVPYLEDSSYKRSSSSFDPSVDEEGNDSVSSLPRRKRKLGAASYFDEQKNEKEDRDFNRNAIVPGNALLDFFSSMYNTTEELPPHLQIQVKRKVFEIVTEAEETALVFQQQQQEY